VSESQNGQAQPPGKIMLSETGETVTVLVAGTIDVRLVLVRPPMRCGSSSDVERGERVAQLQRSVFRTG
jgi:hypothetical protein